MEKRTWRECLIPGVVVGSAEDLGSRPLYVQELDAQGLLCAACGHTLGEGVVLVGTCRSYRVRPCAACAAYKYDEEHGPR